jgi:hypothetical protein
LHQPTQLVDGCKPFTAHLAQQQFLVHTLFKVLSAKANFDVLVCHSNACAGRAVTFALATPDTGIGVLDQRAPRLIAAEVVQHVNAVGRADFCARAAADARICIEPHTSAEPRWWLIGNLRVASRVGMRKERTQSELQDAGLQPRWQFQSETLVLGIHLAHSCLN